MLLPKVQEPFCRFMMFAFLSGLAGIGAAIVLGVAVGLLSFIIAKIQGDMYTDASAIVSLLAPGMPLGALLGTILGAIYGIVRKGE